VGIEAEMPDLCDFRYFGRFKSLLIKIGLVPPYKTKYSESVENSELIP